MLGNAAFSAPMNSLWRRLDSTWFCRSSVEPSGGGAKLCFVNVAGFDMMRAACLGKCAGARRGPQSSAPAGA